jgi:predicted HicB family RNase H-like nuclease
MKNSGFLHMRIEPDLKAKAAKAAEQDNKTLTDYVKSLMVSDIDNKEKEPQRA